MKEILVILGKNWNYYPKENQSLFLSTESKIIAHAAGMLYQSGKYDQLIFSGGCTAGNSHASESKEMARFIAFKYNIPQSAIVLEEVSIDTAQNAEEVKKLVGNEVVDILSIDFHILRSMSLFQSYGVKVGYGIEAEGVILEYGTSRLRNYVQLYKKTTRYNIEVLKERMLRCIAYFDTRGIWLRVLTKKLRHQR